MCGRGDKGHSALARKIKALAIVLAENLDLRQVFGSATLMVQVASNGMVV
jgi:hypothetical protein